MATETDATSRSRLRWRCRRGMRELDVLLTRYLEEEYAASGQDQKAAFARILELPDPVIVGYLLKGERSDDAHLEAVLSRLRR